VLLCFGGKWDRKISASFGANIKDERSGEYLYSLASIYFQIDYSAGDFWLS